MQYLVDKLEYFQNRLSPPSVEALLALKDNLYIPDDRWQYITSTFQLGPGSSLHYIEKHRQALNRRLPMMPTGGGRGYEIVRHHHGSPKQ